MKFAIPQEDPGHLVSDERCDICYAPTDNDLIQSADNLWCHGEACKQKAGVVATWERPVS